MDGADDGARPGGWTVGECPQFENFPNMVILEMDIWECGQLRFSLYRPVTGLEGLRCALLCSALPEALPGRGRF